MTTVLTKAEVDKFRKALGNMCSPMGTITVAQLYLAPASGGTWRYTGVWGAVAVAIDRSKPLRYMIQMLDLENYDAVFRQELYEHMKYETPNGLFHTFEIEDALVGLSFADEQEAKFFADGVRSWTPKPEISSSDETRKPSGSVGFFQKLKNLVGGGEEKMEIGDPTNFQHKQHVGFDPERGFVCDNVPTDWKQVLRSAGVKKADLEDPEKAKIIYETMAEQLGGAENLPAFAQGPPAPNRPAPPRPGAPPPAAGTPGAPPARPAAPPPARRPPAVPARRGPPPPVPSRAAPPIPPGPPGGPSMGGPPPAPVLSDIPPAPPMGVVPPPAPMLNIPAAPPMAAGVPPPPALNFASSPGGPPPPSGPPAPPAGVPSAVAEGGRTDLLAAIRGGAQLRKVAPRSESKQSVDDAPLDSNQANSMIAALQAAMRAKFKNVPTAAASQHDDWDD